MTMPTATNDLEQWFTDLFSPLTVGELQALIVGRRGLIANMPDAMRADMHTRLTPHRLRLTVVHVQTILNRIRDNRALSTLYPTLLTSDGQAWLANELAEVKRLANG